MIICPKCHIGILENSTPSPLFTICRECKTTFTWGELENEWNIDIGDFHDTVSDVPKFPSNFHPIVWNPLLVEMDYKKQEMRLYNWLSNFEPPWEEIEETLWDVPDAYTQMMTLHPRNQTYPETLGFTQDGR